MIPKFSLNLRSKIEKLEADLEEEWVRYVKDHRDDLIRTSSIISIQPDTLNMYIYRPQDYLSKVHSYPVSVTWIFLYLNEYSSYLDFNRNSVEVYLPSMELIKDLRQKFSVFKTNKLKNDTVK